MTGRAVLILGLGLCLTNLASVPEPQAARSDFVGSKRCGSCHQPELKVWQQGPHARAAASIASTRGSACLACHTTGDAPTDLPAERAVGCEACHGPGRGYAPEDIMRDPPLSKALGLRSLKAGPERDAVCKSCHRSSTKLNPIPLAKGWRRIGHGKETGK